jgi:hypothetical protein
MCCLYTTSFLPYGRFFTRLGGNWGFLGSFFFIFFYISFFIFRKPIFIELLLNYIYSISIYLNSFKLNTSV